MRIVRLAGTLAAGCVISFAGPILIGGDDLNDHGSRTGANNIEGWRYIQVGLDSLSTRTTRPGPYTSDIAVLGSADVGPGNYPLGDSAGAVRSAAENVGLSLAFYEGSTAIGNFFAGLVTGIVNPRIVYLPGDENGNSLSAAEGAVLTANAAALDTFIRSGGGLMSHGGASGTAQGWLTALLPGIVLSADCDANGGATLTAAGVAAFPALTSADINAGPCHGSYSGNFGGLQALALDQQQRAFILGGSTGITPTPNPPPVTESAVPEPATLMLVISGLAALAAMRSWSQRA